MEKQTVRVRIKTGLHARPATVLVSAAKRYVSELTLQKGQSSANSKSIISVLGLCVKGGEVLDIIAEGQDEVKAVQAVKTLLEDESIA
ncbi:HPr family phosphocarrier protein [Proteinivorax tanatarense]|uniref:Phosphocarrier protein HPr n=1 Tax=Proteinivorax tanatarense TaxID=1260629 RepID=A0AAU7VN72_9FIRM